MAAKEKAWLTSVARTRANSRTTRIPCGLAVRAMTAPRIEVTLRPKLDQRRAAANQHRCGKPGTEAKLIKDLAHELG
jgi:hypothetical protein